MLADHGGREDLRAEVHKNWVRASFTDAYLPVSVQPVTGAPFAVAMPAHLFFQAVRTVHAGCDKLLGLFGGTNSANFFPGVSAEEASRMGLDLCRCIYGPMSDTTLQAILEWRHGMQPYGA